MELVAGQIVTSRRGRDVTHAYVVLQVQGERVLLCDGAKRTLAAPKEKNPRHIQPTGTVLAADEMETDLTIKRALVAFTAKRAPQQQGG